MIDAGDLGSLRGRLVRDAAGEKIGKVVDVYESAYGGQGTFVTVTTGLFGTGASFVPLAAAGLSGGDVVVPYSRSLVKDAPRVDPDEELSEQEEQRLHEHYAGGTTDDAGAGVADGAGYRTSDDASGRTSDGVMTRSQERLHVGTEKVEAGRARLRKRVVTETETRTVPVSHDEVRIERVPVTDGDLGPLDDSGLVESTPSGEVGDVVLTREIPVVAKDVVAVEQVRAGTETVTEQATVSEHVRKEHIELDRDGEV